LDHLWAAWAGVAGWPDFGGERGYSPPELVTYLANLADMNLEPLQEKASP